MHFVVLVSILTLAYIYLRHVESSQKRLSDALKTATASVRNAYFSNTLSLQELSPNLLSRRLAFYMRPLVIELICNIEGLNNIYTCSTIESIFLPERMRLVQTSIVRAAGYMIILSVLLHIYMGSALIPQKHERLFRLVWIFLGFFSLYVIAAACLAQKVKINSEACISKLMPLFLNQNSSARPNQTTTRYERDASWIAHESKLRFQIEKHPKTLQSHLSLADLVFVGSMGIASFLVI